MTTELFFNTGQIENFRKASFREEPGRSFLYSFRRLKEYDSELAYRGKGGEGKFTPTTVLKNVIAERGKATFLDVGCGSGAALEDAKVIFGPELEVVGVTAARYGDRKGVKIRVGDAQHLLEIPGIEPNHYDLVTCLYTVEYVVDPIAVVDSIYQVLNNGGFGFIAPDVLDDKDQLSRLISFWTRNGHWVRKLGRSGLLIKKIKPQLEIPLAIKDIGVHHAMNRFSYQFSES